MIHTIELSTLSWIYSQNPSQNDINEIQKIYPFHPLDLEDSMSLRLQRPKIDSYPDHVFIILHFPVYDMRTHALGLREVDFFVGKNYLVSISAERFEPLHKFFNTYADDEKKRNSMKTMSSQELLYRIIDELVDACLPVADKISNEIDEADREIFRQKAQKTVERISRIRRNIIFFHTMIKPEIALFTAIEEGKISNFDGKLKDYWGNILDHLTKLTDRLEDYRELIEGIAVANDSVLNYRTNETIKVLTVFSAIMLPLTLLASIYGMNINLPLMSHSLTFLLILGLMGLIAIGLYAFFRVRKWI